MRFDLWRSCSAIVILCAPTIFGQTKVDLRTQTKSVDFSGASSTKPAQVGSALPTTCSQGQFFFLINAPAGQNVYGCSSTNTWSLEGNAIPQASLIPGELNKSGNLLTTDGTNPVWQPVGGDVTGSPTAFRVGGLLGRSLSTTPPANGQLLEFNGTSAQWAPLSIGGDVSGSPNSLQVGALLGRGLSTLPPSDGQLLEYSGASGLWGPLAIGGDIAGTPSSLKVGGLLGRALSTAVPNDGQLLEFNGATGQWNPLALAGDISGKATGIVVGGLQGRSLSTIAPTDGQLLEYNGVTGQWVPLGLTGDVSGKATGMVVGGLLGRPLSTTAPVDGQILEYNASTAQWSPLGFAGDISGKPSGIVVGALQGRAVSPTAPVDGQLLKFSGAASQWQPAALGGDVSGTPSSLTVSGLQGHAVSTIVPASGQFLSWNATSSTWTPSTLQLPPNYNGSFTSATTTTIAGTQHNQNTSNLIVSCYDNASPANLIEPSHVTVDPASYNVTVTFAQVQTGRCVVNGSGGAGILSGIVGPQGIQGAVGASGPQGATGPQGASGPAGPTGASSPGAIPPAYLTSIYNLVDSTGATVPDETGHSNTATLVNVPAVTSQGLTFNSTAGQYVQLPSTLNNSQTLIVYADLTAQYGVATPAVVPLFGNSTAGGLRFRMGEGAEGSPAAGTAAIVTQSGRLSTETGLPTGQDSASFIAVSSDQAIYGPSCYAAVFQSNAADDIYINGQHIQEYYNIAAYGINGYAVPSSGSAALTHGTFTLFGDAAGGGYTSGTAYWAATSTSQLTRAQIAQTCAYAASVIQSRGVNLSPINTNTANLLLFEGDSITANPYAEPPYAAFVAPTTQTYSASSISIGGDTCVGDLYADTGRADTKLSRYAASNIFSLWCGTNDIAGYPNGTQTAQNVWNAMAANLAARKAAGWKTMVATMISRGNIGAGGLSSDTMKNQLNTLIRANYKGYADILVDLAADPRIGADGAWANTTYFNTDGVHPTAYAFQYVIAPYFSIAVDALNSQSSTATISSSYPITNANRTIRCNPSSGTVNVTLPSAIAITDQTFTIENVSTSNTCKLVSLAGQTVGISSTQILGAGATLQIRSNGSNWDIVSGFGTVTPNTISFQYELPIVIPTTSVSSDQMNFPVLVFGTYPTLASTTSGGHSQDPAHLGSDIGFSSTSNCASTLPFDLASYNSTTGQIEAHVLVPVISHATPTTIYACYGNSTVTSTQANPSQVWQSSGYASVFHFGSATAVSNADSAWHSYSSSSSGAPSATTGKIGGAVSLDGNSNIGENTSSGFPSGSSPRTLSLWYKNPAFSNVGTLGMQFFGEFGNVGGNTFFGLAAVGNSSGITLNRLVVNTGAAVLQYPSMAGLDSNWHYLVAELPSGATSTGGVLGYIDGVQQTMTLYGPDAPINTLESTFAIGQLYGPTSGYNGLLDEVRVRSVPSTASWIAAEYANQNSPGTFYSVGAEVAPH